MKLYSNHEFPITKTCRSEDSAARPAKKVLKGDLPKPKCPNWRPNSKKKLRSAKC
ncbi:unnamed protein product [Nesidiocoris tenuis]|uniref:Uncharacterized protein n=1 Tax=Nesidiocoris tenuis TaxID=355587 RepID=A0A6H5G589_9HEMI|nr:unnamed protein product [Nesidiocoris tenuis]CAA9997417.1 unnamed protein product [Nesidiocoris tenuis]